MTKKTNWMKSLLVGAVAVPLLAACVQNPATGKSEFTLMSPSQEAAIGKENHAKILEQFGGAYDDPAVGGYVATVGGRVAAKSELPANQFHFTVLDSPVVNAFALPGGYVYVTRGLMALAKDEAELASVLGHEIGHVTARHGAQRQTRSTLIGLLAVGVSAAAGNQAVSQVAGLAGQYFIASYSREQEFQADDLGLRYISRTPMDPYGSPRFLQRLGDHSELQQRIAGADGRSSMADFFATHPSSPDRVRRATGKAQNIAQPGQKAKGQGAYYNAIDGMIFGDSREQGFIRSKQFLHPIMKLAFKVPDGFTMMNSSAAVQARHDSGQAIIQFDGAKMPAHGSLRRFLVEDWGKGVEVKQVESIRINGMRAETGAVTTTQNGQAVTHRLVAIHYGGDRIYRLHMMAPQEQFNSFADGFQRTTYSFRKLSDREAADLKPYRLRIVTVKRGQTVTGLARQMPHDTFKVERFRVLNGLGPNDTLQAGQKVKLVTER
ncbi:MAG: M48 family metalloprotease [Alphaproteobacteria bacterium]